MILTFIFIELTRSESGDGTGECEWFSSSVIWYSSTSNLKFTVCVLTAWQRQTDGHIMTTGKTDDDCKLVSWCLEPSQPRRITSRLNTNFILSPSCPFHKSWCYESCFFVVAVVVVVVVVVLAYLYFVGTQPGNLHQAEWPILFCGPTQARKNRKRFGKKKIFRWMDWKAGNKQGRNSWQ